MVLGERSSLIAMSYLFDPDELQAIVQAALKQQDLDLEATFDWITTELRRRHPRHITNGPRRWILNNAGGAMGQIALLHGSITEYLLFFGTPIGTEGHSGRYRTEVYDFLIRGEMWTYTEGETERKTTKPGDNYAYLGKRRAKGYKIPSDGWMLEYARGLIPFMLPFGLADTIFSTLDVRTWARTVSSYGKLATGELMRRKF